MSNNINYNELVTLYNCALNTAGKAPALMTISDIAFFPPPLGEGIKMTRSHAISVINKYSKPQSFTLDRNLALRNRRAFEQGVAPDSMSIDEIDRQIQVLNEKKKELKSKKGATE